MDSIVILLISGLLDSMLVRLLAVHPTAVYYDVEIHYEFSRRRACRGIFMPTAFESEHSVMQINEEYVTTEDGVRLFCRIVGDADPAVLVPNASFLYNDFGRLANDRTLIFFDPRNRGRSDRVVEPQQLLRGVYHDVDDIETIRNHFGVDDIGLIGHSYLATVGVLYALSHTQHLNRLIQIGPLSPDPTKQYPAHLNGFDSTFNEVSAQLAQLGQDAKFDDPEFLAQWSTLMRTLFVTEAADVDKITWDTEGLENERPERVMRHVGEYVMSSIQRLHWSLGDLAELRVPVLTIHGRRDRQAPYGGGRDWVAVLGNARLLTVDSGAHLPWIEAPSRVFGAIDTFLGGGWPEDAEQIASAELISRHRETTAPTDE